MMWITRSTMNQLLSEEGYAQLNGDTHLVKASRRLESVPFLTDRINPDGTLHDRPHGRFMNGFVPDSQGNPIMEQPIPTVLASAVAYLAHWYLEFPLNQDLHHLELNDSNTSPFIADLPLRVQNALWPYLSNEAKGTIWENTRVQSQIADSVTQRSTTEEQLKLGRRSVATANFG